MFITVFITTPDLRTANKISQGVLKKRLCACVNIVKGIESFFWWQRKIDKAKECLLVMKTRKSLFKKLEKEVISLHPYTVPEVISLPIVNISRKYAEWLKQETNGG